MDLIPYMFHERQEAGSQLCAQHCLNNLLQQSCYTEIDLADVARKLDEAEAASMYRAPPTKSYNYDDTGYFSISVLEKALQVWDLTLVRWRGEAMKPYVDRPEEQTGFILNLANHWFSLRRFGTPTRWYNMNSFLNAPEWISPMYLQMVLAQAEAEGYSVFVVRKAGKGAGEQAAEDPGEGLGWSDGGVAMLPESRADLMAIELGDVADRRGSGGVTNASPTVDRRSNVAGPSRDRSASTSTALPAYTAGSGRRNRRQEDLTSDFVEEQDMLPSSVPSSRGRTPRLPQPDIDRDILDDHDMAMVNHLAGDDDDDDHAMDDDFEDEEPSRRYAADHDVYTGPTDFSFHSRSYDDEDEALQAALKASMNDLPEGFVLPELKPVQPPSFLKQTPPVAPPPAVNWRPAPDSTPAEPEVDNTIEEDDDDAPAQSLSPEEIRAARLARFQQLQEQQRQHEEQE